MKRILLGSGYAVSDQTPAVQSLIMRGARLNGNGNGTRRRRKKKANGASARPVRRRRRAKAKNGHLVKGSAAAKRRMAKLRGMRRRR